MTPAQLAFQPGNESHLTGVVSLDGNKDVVPEAELFVDVAVTCDSNDRRFDGAAAATTTTVQDVQFPFIERMSPLVTPYVGTGMTIEFHLNASFVDEAWLTVLVGGVDVSQDPVKSTTRLVMGP